MSDADEKTQRFTVIDSHGADVTALRRDWSIAMGVNQDTRTTGLMAGDRLCDERGITRFVADAYGGGAPANVPPPWVLIDAMFESVGLEPCGPG